MTQIVLFGECMIELNGQPFGNMVQTYGGDSLNTAVYLARLNIDNALNIQYLSALGTDNLSRGMSEHWQAEGVGTDFVVTDKTRQPGLYLIQLDDRGERTFLYWRNQSAARYIFQHSDFPIMAEKLFATDVFYLSGISLAILPPEDRQKCLTLIAQLSQRGVKIVFDSNYRPRLWENPTETKACYQQLYPHLHLALVTLDDEKALWGDEDARAVISRLTQAEVKEIVVKDGGNLTYHATRDVITEVPPAQVENVKDTTAAGDSFNAGFLSAYLRGKSAIECCQAGNHLAGIVIQHQGAIIPAKFCQEICK